MKQFLKKQKTEFYLFIGSMFFLVLLGFLLNYNYLLYENYNLMFDFDTGRIFLDATVVNAEHYRLDVHPLFVIIIQPLVLLIKGLVLNPSIAIIFLSSLASSLTVVFLYKIFKLSKLNEKMSIVLSLFYLFSFANIIFTSAIETYNFAAFFLVLLWYFFLKKGPEKEFDDKSYIILGILGVLSFSMTITNYIIFLIVCFVLWVFKKVKFYKLILVGILTVITLVTFNVGQRMIWNNTEVLWNMNTSKEVGDYSKKTIDMNNFKRVVEGDYIHSIISSDVYVKVGYASEYNKQNFMINFSESSIFLKILMFLFYGWIIWIVARNYEKNKMANTAVVLSLVFNSIFHLIYGNNAPFLYSLHFLYLIIILIGLNISTEKNNKVQKYFLIFLEIMVGIEIIQNNRIFVKSLTFVDEIINKNYLLANISYPLLVIIEILVIAITIITIIIISQIIPKMFKEKKSDKKALMGVGILCLLVMIEWMYVALESPKDTNRFLGFHLKGNSGIVEKKKTKTDYIDEDFKKKYKEELKQLAEYQKEYKELRKTHETEDVMGVNWVDYYFYGMGNRKKYVYMSGQIIDLDTREVIITFDEKEHYIIPNLYMVIIETKDKKFYEIKETEEGVFCNDELLKGTDIPIKFYDFSNQKYSNMKKTLYGEILFNIKDSAIYPNIIVYDHPWYRDAAITSMVLKQTNNTDLITDWVSRIEDIYDRQNDGVEEADNLGELLYILSTQEEKRQDLIEKIEAEATRLAQENPNGYYIYGKTDFGDQYLYQNLWYKLGMESLGKEYPFDLESIPEDNYSKMAWWSDYELKDTSPEKIQIQFPYLSYAYYHKLGKGPIPINKNLYPMSWEMGASSANYDNYESKVPELSRQKASSLHSWSASELLLLLLEETGDLQFA